MPRINWVRLIIGILIAALLMFLADGFFHERVVGDDWKAVYQALGLTEPRHGGGGIPYFVVFELGRGILAMSLYVLMRPCCGPGVKTAALAGFVTWIAFSLTGPAQFIPLGFYSHALWWKVGAFQFATSIIATIAGAALYKEG
jgi:hypothetical protein